MTLSLVTLVVFVHKRRWHVRKRNSGWGKNGITVTWGKETPCLWPRLLYTVFLRQTHLDIRWQNLHFRFAFPPRGLFVKSAFLTMYLSKCWINSWKIHERRLKKWKEYKWSSIMLHIVVIWISFFKRTKYLHSWFVNSIVVNWSRWRRVCATKRQRKHILSYKSRDFYIHLCLLHSITFFCIHKLRFCQTSSIFILPTLEADKNPICFRIKKPGLLFCPLSSSWNVQMVFRLCLALGMRNAWEPWALRCNNVFDLYCSYVSRFRAGILYDPPVIANTYWVEERQPTHFDLFI